MKNFTNHPQSKNSLPNIITVDTVSPNPLRDFLVVS